MEATRALLWEAYRDPLNQRCVGRLHVLAPLAPAPSRPRPAPAAAAPRFVLLSESDIPLYDPLTLHQQLMGEGKSRVNACPHAATHDWRWDDSMQARAGRASGARTRLRARTHAVLAAPPPPVAAQTPRMNRSHWRKSGQWIGLTRAHAAVALADAEVFGS